MCVFGFREPKPYASILLLLYLGSIDVMLFKISVVKIPCHYSGNIFDQPDFFRKHVFVEIFLERKGEG